RPPALVFHHIALRIELLLRHCWQELAHSVGFQPQRERYLVGRHSLEVIRTVEPRGSVERAARTLDQLEMLVRANVGRSLKEHVLEQMREPRAAGPLVRRPDMIPEI